MVLAHRVNNVQSVNLSSIEGLVIDYSSLKESELLGWSSLGFSLNKFS